MFTLGPQHRDAFAREGRKRLIADAIAKLVQQGYQATYDDATRALTAVGKGEGPEALLFDESLRLAGLRRPSGRTTRFEYPPGGDCQRAISPGGTVTEADIYAGGAKVELRQSGLGAFTLSNDALGRPETIQYPGGASYRVEWGPDNAPSSVTDRLGAVWRWERDEKSGRLAAMHDPLGVSCG